ncbi:hypothetical protein FDO65_06155 [Nakamurella flava]|uniref:Uncharacterized protein n=1 Tax=Nakamurella flava TaxID=2576308 RepID=A0A4U6QMC9_9ACTN|nr:hypothetical protein [Nakamurella flava]TKV61202.1 hypothetical protein FDO65_06155 [Nakamurella flava]
MPEQDGRIGAATRPGAFRWSRVALELVVAAGAVYGGVGLIAGNSIGMRPEWLAATPFSSWVWPGILLLLAIAVPMTLAALLELRRSPRAHRASLVAAAAQIGWILAQWVIIRKFFLLQPVMLSAGLLLVLLVWLTHRSEPRRRRGWSWDSTTAARSDPTGRPYKA